MQALKFFANKRRYFKKLVEISLNLLARDGGSDDGFSLSSAIVNFVLQKDGIQSARDIYKRYTSKSLARTSYFINFVIFSPCLQLYPIIFSKMSVLGYLHLLDILYLANPHSIFILLCITLVATAIFLA